jgi:mitochondrial fission protein ELM1
MDTPTCWVVTDGKPGMENQCLGLAAALGLSCEVKRVRLRSPWKELSPAILRIGNRWSLSSQGDRLDGPRPDILIATGRQSVSSSLAIREERREKTFRIQIQDPGIDPRYFDLVVVPRHDRLRGNNVLVTKGALTNLSPEALRDAQARFAFRLAVLPRPRIAVLVGGSNGSYIMTTANTRRLAEQLASLAERYGGSLMVTPSRRTAESDKTSLREKLGAIPGEIWDGTGENPYHGYLAYADAVVVTADSVNMVCEAAATGKPVYVAELDGGSPKFQRFHEGLKADGITRAFDGTLHQWTYEPLNETRDVAAAVRRRLGERGMIW